MSYPVNVAERTVSVDIVGRRPDLRVVVDGRPLSVMEHDCPAGEFEVLVDGGIRRGTDVLKALALGARAVLVARPYLWGLAVDGEAGVRDVLQHLCDDLSRSMALAGCARLVDVGPDLLRMP